MRERYRCKPVKTDESSAEMAASLGLPVRGRSKSKILIGRREWLALPNLGVSIISAKVDTGAYTSSLHAQDIESFSKGGVEHVKFTTHDHHGQEIICEAQVVQRKKIKSSTGKGRMRYIIRTTAKTIGGLEWELLLSLANRSVMKCPLLLGRRALSGYFVVDTQASHLFGNITKFTGKTHHKKS
ncbi:MAG: ATP-dependent zinc protease [Akkermansiaceae bacterium]